MVKKIALGLIVILLLVAIPVSIYFVGQQQELRQKAAPATTMSLKPAQKTVQVGETFSLDVSIDTGENSIVAASVYLTFDPAKLQAQSITNSAQFPNILSSGDISQAGKVSIAVGTQSISQPYKGIGTIATVRFSVLQSGDPVVVRFGSETYAGSIGEGSTNALIGTTPATITIGSSSGEPTQTPDTSPTPTSGSGTPIPTTTGGVSSPTPTKVNSPTPTTQPTITPTPIPGQLTISSPANGFTTTQSVPVVSGKAPAGSSVTITFFPGTTTGAVTADSSGNWSFTPPSALGIGTYTITATSTNTVTGATQTVTSTVIIVSSTSTITPTATHTPTPTPASGTTTQTPVPVTGSSDTTYVLMAIAVVFILTGIVLPFAVR